MVIKCFSCIKHPVEFSLISDVANDMKFLAAGKEKNENKRTRLCSMISEITKPRNSWEQEKNMHVFRQGGQGKMYIRLKLEIRIERIG